MTHRFNLLLLAIVLFGIVIPGDGLAMSTDHPMANDVCYECHKKAEFRKQVIHGPVKQDQCAVCHSPHVAKFKGLLWNEGGDFCFSCHTDEEKKYSSGFIHRPVQKGNCLVCHEPHASESPGLLKARKLMDICYSCHASLPRDFKYEHKPFVQGECVTCHNPHNSQDSNLLHDDSDSLCYTCHKEENLLQKHRDFPEKLSNCLTCHNPHGSDRKNLIRDVLHQPFEKGCEECHGTPEKMGSENCLRCHETIKSQLLTIHNHLMGGERNICVTCHSPHAANNKKMLIKRQIYLCRGCHEDRFVRNEGQLYAHPDAQNCSNCHAVHGSNHLAMLKTGANTVCSLCHKTQGQFTHPVGEKILDPRTGQGMTCITCHYPHGTDYKFSLKLSGSKDLCVQCHRTY
ncbi:cytochrome c3 family protein [Thermodesulfobacteriota bacterium]